MGNTIVKLLTAYSTGPKLYDVEAWKESLKKSRHLPFRNSLILLFFIYFNSSLRKKRDRFTTFSLTSYVWSGMCWSSLDMLTISISLSVFLQLNFEGKSSKFNIISHYRITSPQQQHVNSKRGVFSTAFFAMAAHSNCWYYLLNLNLFSKYLI